MTSSTLPPPPRIDSEVSTLDDGMHRKKEKHDGIEARNEDAVTEGISMPANDASSSSDCIYVDWKGEDDPEHPQNWTLVHKWRCALTVMTFSFASASMSSGYGTAYSGVNAELGPYAYAAYQSGITVYLLGIAFAPLILAPLSESFGRYPIMMVSASMNLVFFLGQTLAQNLETIVVTRLIQGCVGSVGNSMSGGYFADMFPAETRANVLSIYALHLFAAQSVGPVYAGFVAAYVGWRWVFWIQMIVCGASLACFILFLEEVRPSVLLARRAKRLTKQTGTLHKPVVEQGDKAATNVNFKAALKESLGRPLRYLATEPIIAFYSLWIGFAWACSYLLLSAIPIVFSTYGGWSTAMANVPNICTFIGCLLSYIFNIFFQDRLYARDSSLGRATPESRLYGCMVGAIAFPVGAFIFAWTGARSDVHWIAPCIGLVIINFGIFAIYLSAYTYLADAYETYASSALAAQSCFRNTIAAFFPLFSRTMYNRMGSQYASTLVGCVALVLGMLPFVLKWRGAQIRARSPAAMALTRATANDEKQKHGAEAA